METGRAPSSRGVRQKPLPPEGPPALFAHSEGSVSEADECRLDLIELPGGVGREFRPEELPHHHEANADAVLEGRHRGHLTSGSLKQGMDQGGATPEFARATQSVRGSVGVDASLAD